jgi:hypothetical protein
MYGSFARSFTLSTPVQADKIQATYKEGVLRISLPKAEQAKPKRIAIAATADQFHNCRRELRPQTRQTGTHPWSTQPPTANPEEDL